MSKEFTQHLESLFAAKPYLYVNGNRIQIPGLLIIITDTKESFPYFQSQQVHVTDETCWDKLKEVFPKQENEVQRLKAACTEIHQKTQMRFTYVQLKTMMMHLAHFQRSNPFLPLLRSVHSADEAIKISRAHFAQQGGLFVEIEKSKDRRMLKLYSQLLTSHYAFILGPQDNNDSYTIFSLYAALFWLFIPHACWS